MPPSTAELAPVVPSVFKGNNGRLVRAIGISQLPYLTREALTLDVTYGRGVWWKYWRPDRLITNDLGKARPDLRADFRQLPFRDGSIERITYDPPYKLNGRPGGEVDERYGVEVPTRWQDRMTLCVDGITGCAVALAPGGYLLVKCQDQVCSGAVRWQTKVFVDHAESLGLVYVDRFDLLAGRAQGREQPKGRKQKHARHGNSQLLILRKPVPRRRRRTAVAA